MSIPAAAANPRVLVVDDDQQIREALQRALRLKGFDASVAVDGEDALSQVALAAPDVLVLDIMMPGVDGVEVCRRVRDAGDRTPILMLTARDGVSDRVLGLESGADDYLVKPFALDELVARIRALLRRVGPDGEHRVLRYADLALDTGTYQVTRGSRTLVLTRTEYDLVEILLANPRQVLPREVIFRRVWGHDIELSSNTLPTFMSSLRKKLEEHGEPRLIHTV
ncbi:MAG: response regulator transcription factor, partial [Nocardioides sp.]